MCANNKKQASLAAVPRLSLAPSEAVDPLARLALASSEAVDPLARVALAPSEAEDPLAPSGSEAEDPLAGPSKAGPLLVSAPQSFSPRTA